MSNTNNTTQAARNKVGTVRASDLIKRAASFAKRGMFDEAIASIEQAILMSPQEPRYSLELANLYMAQNRFVQAAEAIRRAVELDPSNSSAQEQLLRILLDLGRYNDAIAAGRKLLDQFPNNLFARDVLGIAYLSLGHIDRALQVTDELIRLAPDDPAHRFKKAVLMQQSGLYARAVEEFLQVLALAPRGRIADDARRALAALDGYQIRQVLALAADDAVFRARLRLDPENACREKGFVFSPAGFAAVRNIDPIELPGDARQRFYH